MPGSGLTAAVFLALLHSHAVTAFVFGMAGVALQPVVGDFMLLALGQQRGPQIRVQGGGFVSLLPAAGAQPLAQPFCRLSMTYLLSLYRSMAHGSLSWRSASSRAVISMRLLVVLASPPESSFSYTFCAVRNRRIAPQRPGRGCRCRHHRYKFQYASCVVLRILVYNTTIIASRAS